jgi:hypothetical protein
MKQVDLLNRAMELRSKGYSLREISEDLKISKSTASVWLSNVGITSAGYNRLERISDEGRRKGIEATKNKKIQRQQNVANKTIKFVDNLDGYNIDQCKVFLAMLYWGEGAKTGNRLTFINSDPLMIKTYLFLLRKCFKIDESKLRSVLHVHKYHDQDELLRYWQDITGINKKNFSIYQKDNTAKRIKQDYKGCVSIRYGNINLFDEVLLIIDRFKKSIK